MAGKRTQPANRSLLRHAVATLAYRGGKALRGAPENFAAFRAGDTARTPAEILAHIGDLLDWALSLAKGKQSWHNSKPASWQQGSKRFFTALKAFDTYLASKKSLGCSAEKLFQGPVADALTHVGQISMLRRLAGAPVRAENYLLAQIKVGSVGSKQAGPKLEFD
jgi:hypothetical protein